MVVDYRKLNQQTVKDALPLPRIDETLEKLGKAKVYSTIDLKKGFWQVPVAEEDKPKTAFSTKFGIYEFNTMPFGLTNAPAKFQRMMNNLLGDYVGKFRSEEDKPKTAFSTKFGIYEFNTMPFGLTNAPAKFQRMMNNLLGDYVGKF